MSHRSLDVHQLDDGGVTNAVQGNHAIAARAVAHLLGVLKGSVQNLVGGISVGSAAGRGGRSNKGLSSGS